jgi:excisionase family DNA binding protein
VSAYAERSRDRLLSVDEAADYLGVSAYTVRQWAREGKLPAIRLGRYWRFFESSLARWLDELERGAR